jgi:hypothetical protein
MRTCRLLRCRGRTFLLPSDPPQHQRLHTHHHSCIILVVVRSAVGETDGRRGSIHAQSNWNALSASTLMNTLGSATKGYIKELTETMVPGTNTPFVKKNVKKGAPLIWNLTLPNKTLAIRLARVHTPSTEAALSSSVSPLPPGSLAQPSATSTNNPAAM